MKPENLYNFIVGLAEKDPEKIAIMACGEDGTIVQEICYRELVEKIEAAAYYFENLGVKKGDRVALAFNNSPDLLILSWAAWSLGITSIPMDVKRDTKELYRYKLQLTRAPTMIAQKNMLADIKAKYLEGTTVHEFSGLPQAPGDKKNFPWEQGISDIALILFTSGTTAYPKGAKLSLENLLVNAEDIRNWLRITDRDRFLVNLPLHHINSTTFCLAALLAGGSIAIPPNYSNSRFWQQAAKMQATLSSIVQSIVFDQLHREKEYFAEKDNLVLTRMQIGSAPVIAESVKEFRKKFGIPLYQGYGQTETALRVTGVGIDLPQDIYDELIEENSIGSAMPWADIQIADAEGNFLEEEKEGELVVKGPAVMEGYVGEEEAFRDGYFLTGDLGFFRIILGEKYFFLKGRKHEIIIKGGINISPVAIENRLQKISPDIEQAYAVGLSDARYGEEVAVVVCWKKGTNPENAMRRLKCAMLFGSGDSAFSAYERPKYIATSSLDALPVTSTGKIQRGVLKDALPITRYELVFDLIPTEPYRFILLTEPSPYTEASFKLHNNAWAPLTLDHKTFKKNISKQFILLAIDKAGDLAGQVAFIRSGLSSNELLRTPYNKLFTDEIVDLDGAALVCTSISSRDYKPDPVPEVNIISTDKEVRDYLQGGHDPVFRFHQQPKGGLARGAEFVDVIPQGRPEDKSSLGYNMLLKYPPISNVPVITSGSPVAHQLIEAIFLIAHDLGIKNVYAYSRPGGLASYIAKQRAKAPFFL